MNAYSAACTRTSDGHKLLYFGLDKNKDNGTNDAGFWFPPGRRELRCQRRPGTRPLTKASTRSATSLDRRRVLALRGVAAIGTATAYRWDGTTPLVQIASAVAPLWGLQEQPGRRFPLRDDQLGAQAIQLGNITTPWLTSDATLGVAQQSCPPNFFEGRNRPYRRVRDNWRHRAVVLPARVH